MRKEKKEKATVEEFDPYLPSKTFLSKPPTTTRGMLDEKTGELVFRQMPG